MEVIMSEKEQSTDTISTKVCIIGGGGAGLAAAVTAAQKGADVTVIERRRILGGNSSLARGLLGVESPVQKRQYCYISTDDAFKLAMKHGHWQLNPKLIRAFIDKSGDTIRWLEEKGVTFDVLSNWPNQFPRTWHGPRGKGFGHEIIKALAKDCEALGVRILMETKAQDLIVNERGVAGVIAQTKQGQTLRIESQAVIIASGGFGGNEELLRKYFPFYNDYVHLAGVANMGEGMMMATGVGAATTPMMLHLEGCAFVAGEPAVLVAAAQQPFAVWVNKVGERFVDESYITLDSCFDTAWAVVRQPDGMHYSLLDEGTKRKMIEEGVDKGHRASASSAVYPPGSTLPDLEPVLESAVERGVVAISNSWDEIAKWMGADPQSLKATIEQYNLSCDHRRDEFLAKDPRFLIPLRTPPYYAIKCGTRLLGTVGGIKCNEKMEAISKEGNPIPGLYAAGSDVGEWEPETYNFHLSGSTYGFAVNSGRIAGESAAQLVLGK
jgi:fumarate reductase flavoprotein subunit